MSKATSSNKKTGTAKKAAKPSTHPTYLDMIKECIIAHPEDARSGVSRPTIKKFVETKYKVDMNSAAASSQLSRAIVSGSEKGILVLPKGPAGKVKLAPKAKADVIKDHNKEKPVKAAKPAGAKATTQPKKLSSSSKENKPATKTTIFKAAKKPIAKKPATGKTQAKAVKKDSQVKPARKTTAKTSAARSTTTKKTLATTKKTAAAKAKPAAKKPTTKSSDAKKAAAKAAASKSKKVNSKAPASKTKPVSKTKPASKGKPSSKAKAAPAKDAKPASATKA